MTDTNEITHALTIDFIRSATHEVFSTMLAQEVTSGEPYIDKSAAGPGSGVVALVGLAGSWVGAGSLSCTASMACKISSWFLMEDHSTVNEDVLDAVAEITNMIIGNVKTSLEERVGFLGLSVPMVVFGRNFETRNVGANDWVAVPFHCGGEDLRVQLCLAPNRDAHSKHTRAGFPLRHLMTI